MIRHIGTGWGGELLLDWTGSGQDIRIFGTNAHHDLTWTASSSGAVTGTVRYDPAGVATSVTGSVPDFRFQGSWADDVTKLSWVVTRWYAPAQGRFISEDSLLGEPRDPDSRHLYAYGGGDPVGGWDPEGRAALKTCGGLGCRAAPDGATRIRQFRAYFSRFPGWRYSAGCFSNPSGDCRKAVKAGTGWGGAMVTFMNWIVSSHRIDRSRWWNRANGEIVQAALTAWWHLDNHTRRPTMNTATRSFFHFEHGPLIDGPLGKNYYGDTWRTAWKAHQDGLWRGVSAAAGSFSAEPPAERVVIYKVLVNVEFYHQQHLNLDGLLDWATSTAQYPDQYPATKKQACGMWYAGKLPFTPEQPKLVKDVCG